MLGAGHNGLVLQAYLCRAGLRVLSIERLPEAGGPLVSDPDPVIPGLRHNVHAVFLRGVAAMPWFRDLELPRHGVEMIHPELNYAQVGEDGRVLRVYLDVERTCQSIAERSRADAETYRRLHAEYTPVLERVVSVEQAAPPVPGARRRQLLGRSAAGALALATEPWSPREFVERHFQTPALKAALLYVCIIREVDVNARGNGLLVPSIIASTQKAQLCRGGSARLAQGLLADVAEHGGHVLTSAEPLRIEVDAVRAIAVSLADGRRIKTRSFVASTLNPQQLVELVGAERLPVDTVRSARAYRYNPVGPLFGINVALREAPRYADASVPQAALTILGLESPDEIYALYDGGIPSLASLWGTTPTLHDPSQSDGVHHAAFMWQKVPYGLDGDPRHWDDRKDAHAARMLDRWRQFAPNITPDNVRSLRALSPLDTERRFPNLRMGDLGVGWMGQGQQGDDRPFPGAGQYRLPIRGLYWSGGATHPGGNVTGLPGYNAARVIAEDLGLSLWWNPPDPESLWSKVD